MSFENRSFRINVELLMDISSRLGDFTQSLESCSGIPGFLSETLGINELTLAIIRDGADEETGPQVLFCGVSGALARETGTALSQHVLSIFHQTRPLTATEGPALRHAFETDSQLSEQPTERLAEYPRANVLARMLDSNHRMLLIVAHRAGQDGLTDSVADHLELVADQLAKQLGCLVAWLDQSEDLGEPFERLTGREWMVLRGLSSDAGEKQLADQLGLSPHTLHSHIKSIYRKLGVQGRLPLVAKVQQANKQLRAQRLSPSKKLSSVQIESKPAIALG